MRKRYISKNEIRTLLDCEAKWGFKYDDKLAGDALEPILLPARITEGGHWDRIIKAYNHGEPYNDILTMMAMTIEDFELRLKLIALLSRYSKKYPPMHSHTVEPYYVSLYPHLDVTIQPDDAVYEWPGNEGAAKWFVEYKLRGSLTSVEYLQRDLQGMLYVYGARVNGEDIKGVIYDETLNEEPPTINYNKDGRPSKRQTCTAEEYAQACYDSGIDPDPEVVVKLETRRIHQRVMIEHFSYDLEDMERYLKSIYSHITYLEQGLLYPARVRNPIICRSCEYNSICEHPEPDLVDFTFKRKPAKRNRTDEPTRTA